MPDIVLYEKTREGITLQIEQQEQRHKSKSEHELSMEFSILWYWLEMVEDKVGDIIRD